MVIMGPFYDGTVMANAIEVLMSNVVPAFIFTTYTVVESGPPILYTFSNVTSKIPRTKPLVHKTYFYNITNSKTFEVKPS